MRLELNPYQIQDVPGNRALVFVVNRADRVGYSAFVLGVIPALNHFGIPYRLLDVSTRVFPDLALESAGLVLGHDGVGSALGSGQRKAIAEAAGLGLGLASFDGRIAEAHPELRELFGIVDPSMGHLSQIGAVLPQHYLAQMQEPGEVHALKAPVPMSVAGGLSDRFEALFEDDLGRPAVVVRGEDRHGGGRVVALLFSPEIWLRENFGHCMGLDDLFWRSLVWIAAKPFPMLAMPPFVTCRIDDASGSYDHFDYLDILNEFSWIPNIGLFIEDIDEKDARAIKRHHDDGTAQFSGHAFHEIGSPAPDLIYMKHDGTEYSLAELADHFARLDQFFGRVGIDPARTMNAHYSETGLRSIPFLKERGESFTMGLIPYGVNWGIKSYAWEPYPYGNQGMNYGPMAPDTEMWNVISHYCGGHKMAETHIVAGEFLNGMTRFAQENRRTDVSGAVTKALRAIKVGVGSGFFGTLMTHEQRIAAITHDEFRSILSGIADGLSGWPVIYRSYDEISQYAKDKARTRIIKALYDPETDNLIVDLEGVCEAGLACYVFKDHDDHCIYDLVDTAPFVGRYTFPE